MFLRSSAALSRITEPITGPRNVPAPPSMATMAISLEMSIESTWSGTMNRKRLPYNPPPRAVRAALIRSAQSLQRVAFAGPERDALEALGTPNHRRPDAPLEGVAREPLSALVAGAGAVDRCDQPGV